MNPNCNYITNICKSIKNDMEENYLLNRDSIIKKLYWYFRKNPNEKLTNQHPPTRLISKIHYQKYISYNDKLRNIQQMIENGDDETNILIELEILEASAHFLDKCFVEEEVRKRGKGIVKPI